MGYSISETTMKTIERRRAEGRLCQMERAHTARATVKVTERSWSYAEDAAVKDGKVGEMVYCERHFERNIRPFLGRTAVELGTNIEFLFARTF